MTNPPLPYDINSNGESFMGDGQGRRVEPTAPVAAYLQGLCIKVTGCDYVPTPEEFGTVLGMAMGREGVEVPAGEPVRDGGAALCHDAREAARAWLHGYGIRTERYIACGGDHPAMDTLPTAFETFALAMRLPPLEPPPPVTPQPEPGAGEDDAAWLWGCFAEAGLTSSDHSWLQIGRSAFIAAMSAWLARRGARAPVEGAEPVMWQWKTPAGWRDTRVKIVAEDMRAEGYLVVPLYAHPPATPVPPAEVPVGGVSAEQEAENFIQAEVDRAPEPLRRLGRYLADVLDEDQFKTAEKMLLGGIAARPRDDRGAVEAAVLAERER